MGSELQFESEYGEGSEFYFNLQMELSEVSDTKVEESFDINKSLIIDKNKSRLNIIDSIMKQWGIETIFAKSYKEGIKKFEHSRDEIDLLLTDYNVEGRNGLEISRQFRDKNAKQPIILFHKAFARNIDSQTLKKYDISTSLEKPIKTRKLKQTIKQFSKGIDSKIQKESKEKESKIFFKQFDILIAEDNNMNMLVEEENILGTLPNTNIIEAENGVEAVEKYRKNNPDLIFMDMQMPEMDGYEATRTIRQDDNEIPIIALTAGVLRGEKKKAKKAGINSFLGKPVRQTDLKDCILYYLAENKIQNRRQKKEKDHSKIDEPTLFKPQKFTQEYLSSDMIMHNAIESLPTHFDKVKRHYQNGQYKKLRQSVHTIKGVAANIYTPALYKVSLNLEKAARQENGEEIGKALEKFKTIYNKTIKTLKDYNNQEKS